MNSMQTFNVYPNLANGYYYASDASTSSLNESLTLINEKNRSNENVNKRSASKKKNGKSTYKHIPHREKPPHLVARRNARERKRVQAVNLAFQRLRKAVPVENRTKRLSKVKTLQRAIEYINNLAKLLEKANAIEANSILASSPIQFSSPNSSLELTSLNSIPERCVNKENYGDFTWHSIDKMNNNINGNEINAYVEQYNNHKQSTTNLDAQVIDVEKNYCWNYY